ncbi:MAG: hypothetical protein EOO38_06225 [Cytophagaceae bacterium]|nr:MAG: hypothetical protein EOO38_06225 [Cytophagaceae bacterium]
MKTIEPYDSLRREYYSPSFEERKAIEAVSRGDEKTAKLWYDRAIMADPIRGTRIFSQCIQLDTPLMNHYSGFVVHSGDNSKKDFRWDLFGVCSRLMKNYKEAEVYTDELMKDLRLWDEPVVLTPKNMALLESTSQQPIEKPTNDGKAV